MNTTSRWPVSSIVLLLLLIPCRPAIGQSDWTTEREVSFQNESVELKGTLLFPTTGGRHPAVVFLHGSVPTTRAGARAYVEEFVSIGIASLFFDKRGSGASTRSWITSSLEHLAKDAVAAGHLGSHTIHCDEHTSCFADVL